MPRRLDGARNRNFGQLRKPLSEHRYEYRRIDGQRAHRLLVEQRTGIKLPARAHVHHVDPNDKLTNTGLFVVCEDNAYHMLIEYRTRAYEACGHANYCRCMRCGKWDDPKNLIVKKRKGIRGNYYAHQERGRVCVDLTEPRAYNAGFCDKSPSGRHKVLQRPDRIRRKYMGVGNSATCSFCQQPIRREGRSVRWHAVASPSKENA